MTSYDRLDDTNEMMRSRSPRIRCNGLDRVESFVGFIFQDIEMKGESEVFGEVDAEDSHILIPGDIYAVNLEVGARL